MTLCQGCYKYTENKQYCNSCLKKMFKGKTPILNLEKSDFQKVSYEMSDHFSISGVQDKISLKLEKSELVPTIVNGEYILKPVPQQHIPKFQNDVPANEHLTMQIAKQIFKIPTAENALIYFTDGEPAYITKRFDRRNGEKVRQEDFCQLAGISPETNGKNYKYDFSVQVAGNIIKEFCSAFLIELEKFFKLALFNYVFGNGDAHFKNFSLIETQDGDFVHTPAYDLLNTTLHYPEESRMALDLFDDFETKFYKQNGFYGYEDFIKLAEFYKIKQKRAIKIIKEFPAKDEQIIALINSSFLSGEAKDRYIDIFLDRIKAIS